MDDLGPTDTVTSAVWTVTVAINSPDTDPNPALRLVGVATLVTPAGTSRQTATQQRMSGFLPNVVYIAQAVVTTSASDTKSLWAHIFGEPVT